MKTDLHSLNNDQRLYVLTCGGGYSCLGYDVCEERTQKLAAELGEQLEDAKPGTAKHYERYCKLISKAGEKHKQTGWRSVSELNPNLIGLEGKRIEAILYGERTRFLVGKSGGFIPVHIELKNKRSTGGGALPSDPKKLQVIRVIQ